jgi:hypothetical protein
MVLMDHTHCTRLCRLFPTDLLCSTVDKAHTDRFPIASAYQYRDLQHNGRFTLVVVENKQGIGRTLLIGQAPLYLYIPNVRIR